MMLGGTTLKPECPLVGTCESYFRTINPLAADRLLNLDCILEVALADATKIPPFFTFEGYPTRFI
jgi:hypothetical protein